MKKIILLVCCLCCFTAIFAQEEQKQGDEMAAGGNYSAAAMMYRLCMEQEEPCALKLFKLIYEEKVEPESTNELYQLVSPLAAKDNAEAQFYLGELYRKGIGGVEQDNSEALKWLRKSADKNYADAHKEWEELSKRLGALGDDMVMAEKYDEAAAMYRLCLESDAQYPLKLFKLIYEKKTAPSASDELHQLMMPLALQGNAEAQYNLGIMYRTGVGVAAASDAEALKWLQRSADQDYTAALNEITAMEAKQVPATPPVLAETPPAQTVTTPPEQTITTPFQTKLPPTKETKEKKPSTDNLQYKPSKSKLPAVFYAVGGIAIAAGVAGTYLSPKTKTEDVYENRKYDDNDGVTTYGLPEKRNPVYIIAGSAAGVVCIGTGIIISNNNKKRLNAFSENNSLRSLPRHDDVMRLNLIAIHNGAGLRLTF